MEYLGPVVLILIQIVTIALPILVLVWFVRTLMDIRREQAQLVTLVASIEAELRARGDRDRWDPPPA